MSWKSTYAKGQYDWVANGVENVTVYIQQPKY